MKELANKDWTRKQEQLNSRKRTAFGGKKKYSTCLEEEVEEGSGHEQMAKLQGLMCLFMHLDLPGHQLGSLTIGQI